MRDPVYDPQKSTSVPIVCSARYGIEGVVSTESADMLSVFWYHTSYENISIAHIRGTVFEDDTMILLLLYSSILNTNQEQSTTVRAQLLLYPLHYSVCRGLLITGGMEGGLGTSGDSKKQR